MAGSNRFRKSETCPNCKERIVHECGADPTHIPEQPTAPRSLRQRAAEHVAHPDAECQACVETGLVRAEAAASVPAPEQHRTIKPRRLAPGEKLQEAPWARPAPEQEEAVPRFDNPRRCAYCGSKGEHLPGCDNPSLATPPPVPAAPPPLWRLQGDYVVDREGLVWRVVRDGGMATRADYTGIESIGIEALRSTKGPLTSLNDFVDAAAAAVPAAPGLDVERLAIAFDNLHFEIQYVGPGDEPIEAFGDLIEAEYARLSSPEASSEGGSE